VSAPAEAAPAAASHVAKATRREWVGLAVLTLPCLIYAMDITVLHLAVPAIARDLEPTSAELLWIIDIYTFFVAGSLITMGTLGDRIGRRRLLLIGATAFAAASLLAAFAPTAKTLILARALLGVAGATLAPSTLSLIRNMFLDEKERMAAIGIWVAGFSTGSAIGPVVGGVMLQHFWWGSVFLLALPVMALLLVTGPRLLPEFRDPGAGRLDLPSAALSAAAVLSLIWGLKETAQDGLGVAAVATLLLGLALAAAFARRQLHLPEPLIDLRLFRTPAFGGALAINVVSVFTAFGFFLFMSQYLQLVLGLSPLVSGLWTTPSGILFAMGSVATPILVQRLGRFGVLAAGFAVSAVGFVIVSRVGQDGLWAFVLGQIVLSAGLAPLGAVTTDLVVGAAPPEKAGAAAATSETSFELGAALGVALLGSLSVAIYRGALGETAPAGVPAEAWETARSTLGGAVDAAAALPEAAGALVLRLSRDAFMQGFTAAAILCGVGLALLSVAVFFLSRRAPRGPAGGLAAETPQG
jgi:DHA2 family multidrug resistance protein-like MFS transporter